MEKDNDTVLIFIYFPGQWIVKATVLKSATTKDLESFMPEKNVSFLYNGTVLNSKLTFRFYGIRPRDIIVCVNKKEINRQWLSLTNKELVNERISSIIDPGVSLEIAKIRDFQLSRFERKPKLFRKMCMQIEEATSSQSGISIPLVVPKKNEKPSDSPLPNFWSSSVLLNTLERSSSLEPSIVAVRSDTETVGAA